MTKFIPTDLGKIVKDQLDKIERFKKILTDVEIEDRMPMFIKHYKDPKNKNKIYTDNARDWLFIQTPEIELDEENEPTNGPLETNSKFNNDEEDPNCRWSCVFKLGQISVFATESQFEKMRPNTLSIVTGKYKTQYRFPGSSGYYKNLEEVAKALNKSSITELTEDEDYTKTHKCVAGD